jgi:hypothetical protein
MGDSMGLHVRFHSVHQFEAWFDAETVTRNSSSKKKVTIASPSNEFEDV